MSALAVDNLSHTYRGAKTPALATVSLHAEAGEVVCLVGPNGAGKSTLLRSLLTPATAGTVAWFDKPLADWPRRDFARRVAFLPQAPAALPGVRVGDVLASGRVPHWSAFGVESAADRAAVQSVADSLDISDWLDRPLDTLSGGQRQRVFLGRCLAQLGDARPAAVLLDEPDAHLDLARVAELRRLIRSLADNRGLLVVVASHDLNVAARAADRIVLLANGRVVASGLPGDVLNEAHLSRAYQTELLVHAVQGNVVVVPR